MVVKVSSQEAMLDPGIALIRQHQFD